MKNSGAPKIKILLEPLCRHWFYGKFKSLFNSIVKDVHSISGYDMEDAMIINRASIERGFAYGTVYKSYFIDILSVISVNY